MGARPRLGRRPGRDPGSRLGAELPGRRRHHDASPRPRRRPPARPPAARRVGALPRAPCRAPPVVPRGPLVPRHRLRARLGVRPGPRARRVPRLVDGAPGVLERRHEASPALPPARPRGARRSRRRPRLAGGLTRRDAPADRRDRGAVGHHARRPRVRRAGVATVQALFDATQIDPAQRARRDEFAPYEQVGERTVERRVSGGIGVVTFRFPLRCLEEGCDTSGARGVAEFETGRIVYRFRDSPNDAFGALDWPPFEVASRVSEDDVENIRWRAAENSLPDASYRASPAWLAALLLAVAAALGAGAVLLARAWWWQPLGRRLAGAGRPDRDAARARSRARARGVAERRRSPPPARARAGRPRARCHEPPGELEDEARALAWSQAGSTDAEVESLVRRAEDGAR